MLNTTTPSITLAKDEVLDFFAAAPSQDEILSFKLSEESDEVLQELMNKNNDGSITPDEKERLSEFVQLEHFVTMIRRKILLKRKNAS